MTRIMHMATPVIWEKCVFLSLPALGASAYVQHHLVTHPFGAVYCRLFASEQHSDDLKKQLKMFLSCSAYGTRLCAFSLLLRLLE